MNHTENQSEPSLVETMPASVVAHSLKAHRITMWATVAGCGVIGVAVGTSVPSESRWLSVIIGGLLFGGPAALIAFAFNAVMRHEFTARIPTAELRDNELTLRYGKRVVRANVMQCRLWRGRACRMRLPGCPKLHCYTQAILIDFPRIRYPDNSFGLSTRLRLAVGYTDEMRDKWERSLSIAYRLVTPEGAESQNKPTTQSTTSVHEP